MKNLEDEFRGLVENKISESYLLEFKQSEIVSKNRTAIIAKEVCAFANSVGGELFIGVAELDSVASELDGGCGKDKTAWIEAVVAQHIKPPIVGVSIQHIEIEGGHYHKIIVPRSASAPHQAHDKKYYRRSGTHSSPLEHYEIEDIRTRSAYAEDPIDIEINSRQSVLAVMKVTNRSREVLENVTLSITPVFTHEDDIPLKVRSFEDLCFVKFHGGQSHEFNIGRFPDYYTGNSDKRTLEILISYSSSLGLQSKTVEFEMTDFKRGLVPKSEVEVELNSIRKALEGILRAIERIG